MRRTRPVFRRRKTAEATSYEHVGVDEGESGLVLSLTWYHNLRVVEDSETISDRSNFPPARPVAQEKGAIRLQQVGVIVELHVVVRGNNVGMYRVLVLDVT